MESLPNLAKKYLACRSVSRQHEKNVIRVAAKCRELSADAVNAYLKARMKRISTVTAKTERTILLCIWRWAYDTSLVDLPPRGVMKVKVSRKPTKAWTEEQCRLLLERTQSMRGVLRSGAKLGSFLRCWILLGYEAGARRGDLFSLRAEDFDGDTLRWTQHKTGDPINKVLTKACVEAVSEMLAASPDGTVLGWACGARQQMRIMRQFLDATGVGGTSKWLRRSGATHIEIREPGKARHHLGHRSLDLAAKAYIDWSQVRRETPRTPELVG